MHLDDDSHPLVSIVTPSFNQGRFIAATIESVLSQDYPNIEYVIVDGASTDDTAEVVARYTGRLTFVSEPDRGQSEAINKGFRRARGEIVAWLNSDDIFLPGAISAAVSALHAEPDAGAVYGEGFRIDEHGAVISRFESTQRFDLWRLLNLSDYILQQTVFFRRSVFDEIGWVDEELHYGLDWELLMRIGLRRPLVYIPHEMGAIREYATAKSFAGGAKRARELTRILRRHTGKRFPPGMFVYGLPTYERIINERIGEIMGRRFAPLAARIQRRVARLLYGIVGRIVQGAQGWYTDEWATTRAYFSFPPSRGRRLVLNGSLPAWTGIVEQEITFSIDGERIARERFGTGDFTLAVALPPETWEQSITVTLRARTSFEPASITAESQDRRKLCYLLHTIGFEADAQE